MEQDTIKKDKVYKIIKDFIKEEVDGGDFDQGIKSTMSVFDRWCRRRHAWILAVAEKKDEVFSKAEMKSCCEVAVEFGISSTWGSSSYITADRQMQVYEAQKRFLKGYLKDMLELEEEGGA